MELKIYLKTESNEAAAKLGNRIWNDVKKGKHSTWDCMKIPSPNNSISEVIYHNPASNQFTEKGKDVCFRCSLMNNCLVISCGLLSNWCQTPCFDQQQLHLGRLTSMLLTYRPDFKELIIL